MVSLSCIECPPSFLDDLFQPARRIVQKLRDDFRAATLCEHMYFRNVIHERAERQVVLVMPVLVLPLLPLLDVFIVYVIEVPGCKCEPHLRARVALK
eukprot:8845785-Pyramimonas_sp.AAC.1